MAQTAQIQVRIDQNVKDEAQKVFESLGLSLSSAIKMFCTQSARTKKLPFDPNQAITENGYTVAYEKEILEAEKEAMADPKTYDSAEELFEDILNEKE